jgi:hypothetical protein
MCVFINKAQGFLLSSIVTMFYNVNCLTCSISISFVSLFLFMRIINDWLFIIYIKVQMTSLVWILNCV